MTGLRLLLTAAVSALAALAALLVPATAAARPTGDEPGDRVPIFDFSNAFYAANGVRPAALAGRRSGSDGLSVTGRAPDRNHRGVRVTFTLPAYDTSGGEWFFTVLADLAPTAFTNNAAGRAAKAVAESSPVYVFPVRDGDATGVGNNRQADMVDLRHGYFSNNPLGLWVHVFVNWTPAAFNTPAGRSTLAALARRNGTALDGTPVITDVGEIDDLTARGLVTQTRRPETETGRWFVCPVYKDPRRGAIAADAFLATVRRADGTPLPAEQFFLDDFESLRLTGETAGAAA